MVILLSNNIDAMTKRRQSCDRAAWRLHGASLAWTGRNMILDDSPIRIDDYAHYARLKYDSTNLEVASVDPDSSLRDRVRLHKFEIERPDTVMLSDR